jgi:hypothetical protein
MVMARRLAVIMTAAVLPAALFGYVDTAWVRTYQGTTGLTNAIVAMKVDDSGNVYGAGYSQYTGHHTYKFLTIKYRPGGESAWARVCWATANSNCQATAVGFDPAGNVYVAGFINGSGTPAGQWGVVKYSPTGDSLWAVEYLEGSRSRPDAMVVDDSGNLYIAGEIGDGTHINYGVLKYRTDSTLQWAAIYSSGTLNPTSRALAIAIDKRHNVFVTGVMADDATGTDYGTIKFDPLGDTVWVARYISAANGASAAAALVLDSVDNVYVTGSTLAFDGYQDYATVKYDSTGKQIWAATYDDTAHAADEATAIALDSSGAVCVTGWSENDTGANSEDYETIKYNPVTGESLWSRRYDGTAHQDDAPVAVAADLGGNFYVTGASQGESTMTDCATLKYDANGNLQWVERYDGPTHSIDQPYALAVDPFANVYLGGETYGDSGVAALTIKYTQTLGCEEPSIRSASPVALPRATIVHGELTVPLTAYRLPLTARLLNIAGRKVLDLKPGLNDVSRLAPGVYFVSGKGVAAPTWKVVIAR